MPEIIENVETQDDFTDQLTLGGTAIGNVRQISFQVLNNSAVAQFYKPVPGMEGKATLETINRVIQGGTYGAFATGVAGVRFRSAAAGFPAVVTAEMTFKTDPVIYLGTITAATIDPSGETNPLLSEVVQAAGPGDSVVVAAIGAQRIRVLSVGLMADAPVGVQFLSGAGGPALTGVFPLVASTGFVLNAGVAQGWFQADAGDDLALSLDAAANVGGVLTYRAA